MAMTNSEMLQIIKEALPAVEEVSFPEKYVHDSDLHIRISKEQIHPVCEYIKLDRTLAFDMLDSLTAVDWIKENKFEVVYHLLSLKFGHRIIIKVSLDREENPSIPSIVDLYQGADWQERETYDLFGIRFVGHPSLRRILLWEGYLGWPLRKDYVHITDRYDSGAEIGTPKSEGTPAITKLAGPPEN